MTSEIQEKKTLSSTQIAGLIETQNNLATTMGFYCFASFFNKTLQSNPIENLYQSGESVGGGVESWGNPPEVVSLFLRGRTSFAWATLLCCRVLCGDSGWCSSPSPQHTPPIRKSIIVSWKSCFPCSGCWCFERPWRASCVPHVLFYMSSLARVDAHGCKAVQKWRPASMR